MKIRLAVPQDQAALIDLAKQNQAETVFGDISVNSLRVNETLNALFHLNHGKYVLIVAENAEGKLVAGLLGCVERYYFSDELQAQLVQWYLLPSVRGTSIALRLVKAFVEWAKSRGASEVFMGITSGIHVQQTDSMMKKMGFTHLGGNYAVKLKSQTVPGNSPTFHR